MAKRMLHYDHTFLPFLLHPLLNLRHDQRFQSMFFFVSKTDAQALPMNSHFRKQWYKQRVQQILLQVFISLLVPELWWIEGLRGESFVFEEFIDLLLRKEIHRKCFLIQDAGYGCVHLWKPSEMHTFHVCFSVMLYFVKFFKNLMTLTAVQN